MICVFGFYAVWRTQGVIKVTHTICHHPPFGFSWNKCHLSAAHRLVVVTAVCINQRPSCCCCCWVWASACTDLHPLSAISVFTRMNPVHPRSVSVDGKKKSICSIPLITGNGSLTKMWCSHEIHLIVKVWKQTYDMSLLYSKDVIFSYGAQLWTVFRLDGFLRRQTWETKVQLNPQ